MTKDKIKILAILFLAISILIGSSQIANSLEQISMSNLGRNDTSNIASSLNYISREINHLGNAIIENSESKKGKEAMYMTEAAEYLGLSFKELQYLIEVKKVNIPYIKIDSKYIFYKESLDNWIMKMDQKRFQINE